MSDRGERGPHGDHGQAGDTGETGARGYPGPVGHEGVAGERGQVGDTGQRGQPGPIGLQGKAGERGSPGVPSWAVRYATVAWGLMFLGVVLGFAFTGFVFDRFARAVERFEREAVATDEAFCALTNRTWTEINRTRAAARRAYNLLQPAPGATPEAAARTIKLREDLLATIDGDLPLLDCAGIGNGEVDFSLQDAIRNNTIPTPSTTTTTPGAAE